MARLILQYAAFVAAVAFACMASADESAPASSDAIRVSGRALFAEGAATLAYPGIEIEARFRGSRISFRGEVKGQAAFFNASVDGRDLPRVDLGSGPFEVALAESLDPDAVHTLRLVRRNEAWHGLLRIDSFETDGSFLPPPQWPPNTRRMLCIGDSITSGEAADLAPPATEKKLEHWNAEASYGWALAKRFDARVSLVACGGRGLARDWQGIETGINAPEFFELTLPDDRDALWDHAAYQPDLVTICLGTNDFSQGIPERDEFVGAYIRFVERIHEVHPAASILLISGPWFADGDPKKEALNRYLGEVVRHFAATSDMQAPAVRAHFFDTTYPGTPIDAHPTAVQHAAMADDIERTIRGWLGW